MKKLLFMPLLLLFAFSAGCNNTQTNTPESKQEPIENSQTPIENLNDLSVNCPVMIKETLNKLIKENEKLPANAQKVAKGQSVTVHYIGRLDDKEVFDTSREEIAKACGSYNKARNYNEGLTFTVGAGQMIAGFDKGVEGMKIGETKTVTIPAKEAYGEWSSGNLITLDRSQLPTGDYQKGLKLMNSNGQSYSVYDVAGDKITLDGNHELAGKDLIFDITVVSIK